MGSFDSSNAAGFPTKPLFAKPLTTIVNGNAMGSFVKFPLDELATLATIQPLATDNGQ